MASVASRATEPSATVAGERGFESTPSEEKSVMRTWIAWSGIRVDPKGEDILVHGGS